MTIKMENCCLIDGIFWVKLSLHKKDEKIKNNQSNTRSRKPIEIIIEI
jgi:hypothetical protein